MKSIGPKTRQFLHVDLKAKKYWIRSAFLAVFTMIKKVCSFVYSYGLSSPECVNNFYRQYGNM